MNFKTTLLSAALAVSALSANAGTVATMPNQAGGKIRLFDSACTLGTYPTNKDWKAVTANSGDGTTTDGCWMFDLSDDSNSIVIVWSGGKTSVFASRDFNRTAYAEQLIRNAK